MAVVSSQRRSPRRRAGHSFRPSACIVAWCAVVAASGFVCSGSSYAQDCKVPPELIKLKAPLPNLAKAVLAKAPIRIVALGSSSTWGTGASSRARTYPARLERELRRAWPASDVRVINAGIGGQLARDMVKRIARDVAVHKPQLVIWQTGVNDAVRGVPLERLKNEMRTGIHDMQSAGADVALIDQQFYPRFKRVKNGQRYLAAVREAGKETGVPVVQRFRIMQHLIKSAQFTPATLLAPDQFHLNDNSYGCLGRLLAKSLRSAAARAKPVAAQKAASKAEM